MSRQWTKARRASAVPSPSAAQARFCSSAAKTVRGARSIGQWQQLSLLDTVEGPFAGHQPVTLAIETLRELTSGVPVGDQATAPALWLGGLTLAALALTQ